MSYYVYVMGSKETKKLYVGMTPHLTRKVYEHKNNLIAGFSNEYKVDLLLYYEEFGTYDEAIEKEKLFQKWSNRDWLLTIIANKNPFRKDLSEELEVYI